MTFKIQSLASEVKVFLKSKLISLVFLVASGLLRTSDADCLFFDGNLKPGGNDRSANMQQDQTSERTAKKSIYGLFPVSSFRVFFFDQCLLDRYQSLGKGFSKCRNFHPIRQTAERQPRKSAAGITGILSVLSIQKMKKNLRSLFRRTPLPKETLRLIL